MNDQNLVNKPVDVKKIIEALRCVKVETGSLMCMGCGYEHNCGIHGCAIMNMAADRLANDQTHIAALQREIEKLRSGRRWIPVTERLPSGDEQVLVVVSGKPKENITLYEAVELATLYSDGWCLETWPEWTGADVTHWMPLPEAPEVK